MKSKGIIALNPWYSQDGKSITDVFMIPPDILCRAMAFRGRPGHVSSGAFCLVGPNGPLSTGHDVVVGVLPENNPADPPASLAATSTRGHNASVTNTRVTTVSR